MLRIRKLAMLVLLIAGLVLSACSTSKPRTGERASKPPIQSELPEVQGEFEDAMTLLEKGHWDEAVDAFRLLQSANAGDPTADLAELFIARGLMGDLDAQFASDLTDVDPEVFRLLIPLSEANDVDERVRFGAQVYLGLARALQDEVEQGLEALQTYPGASLSPVILERDRLLAWPLVAEALLESGRAASSLHAWARHHQLIDETLAEERGEEVQELATETIEGGEPDAREVELRDFQSMARAEAFRIDTMLGDEDLQQALASEYPLERAVGAWTYIQRGTTGGSRLSEESIEVLQEVFNEVAPDFLAIDAVNRASELSVAIASVSGPERLVVGALLPLSGPNRSVGQQALSGMLVALRSFHVAGEPTVTLVIADSNQGLEEGYRELVFQGALAIVGPMQTTEAQALREIVQEERVPLVSLTADRVLEATEEVGEIPVFRNFLHAQSEARAAARLSFEVLGDRRAAVLYPDMGYGQAMAQAFTEEFRGLGGEVVAEVSYDRQSSDYVQPAKAIARQTPDAIFLPDTGAKVAEISAFLAQENIWGHAPEQRPSPRAQRTFVHFLGTSLWQDQRVLTQASSYINGALVPAWYSPVFEDRESRQFTTSYEAIYGRQADHFEAFAFDSVHSLRTILLEQNPGDGDAMTAALGRSTSLEGATGEYQFGANGEPRRLLRYLEVKDGEWVVYEGEIQTPLGVQEEPSSREVEGL